MKSIRNVNVPPPIWEGDVANNRNSLTHPEESEYDPRQRIQSLLVNFARFAAFGSCKDDYGRGRGLVVFHISV